MSRSFRLFLVCWITSSLVFAGCGQSNPPAKFRIVLIPKGTTHVFWQAIHAGGKKAAEEHGDVELIWRGPNTEADRQGQQDIVQNYVTEGVDAIVLAPIDRESLVAPVEQALREKISVVIIDSGLKLTEPIKSSNKYLGYVATDNKEGGRKAARRMVDLLKGKKKARVMMMRYQAGSESTEMREAGFVEEIKKHPHIELIIAAQEAGATLATAQNAADLALDNHKNLNGIFMPNESSTQGMLQSLRSINQAGKIILVGFDGSPELIEALRKGEIHGLVLQDPFDMGYQAVRRAIRALEGEAPSEMTLHTNLQVATKENVDSESIRKMWDMGN